MNLFRYIAKYPYILVGIGGALGSIARAGLMDLVTRKMTQYFVIATLIINITGSFVIGLIAGCGEIERGKFLFSPTVRAFFVLGLMGGYTTFSSFSLETFLLIQQGSFIGAFLNIFLAVFLSIISVWIGFSIIRTLQLHW